MGSQIGVEIMANDRIKSKLINLMLGRNGLQKASFEADVNESSFEQAFSSLAHIYIRDKSPSLMDYEIGFQLIDKSSDNSKAVGVIGFKVDTIWILVPVFFHNGELKGHEHMWIKNFDLFVPLKERWVNLILKKRSKLIGSDSDKSKALHGIKYPSAFNIFNSQYKYSSAKVAEWAKPIVGMAIYNDITDCKEDRKILDLGSFLKSAGVQTLSNFIHLSKRYPQLISATNKFYVWNTIVHEALSEYEKKGDCAHDASKMPHVKRKSKKIFENYDKYNSRRSTEQLDLDEIESECDEECENGVKKEKRGAKVTVISIRSIGKPEFEFLTDDETKTVISGGIAVKDYRKDDEVSEVFDMSSMKLSNPSDGSGLYDVMLEPGKFEECLVILNPIGNLKSDSMCLIIPVSKIEDGEAEYAIFAPRSAVVTKKKDEGTDSQKRLNSIINGLMTAEEAVEDCVSSGFPSNCGVIFINQASASSYRITGSVPVVLDKPVISTADGKLILKSKKLSHLHAIYHNDMALGRVSRRPRLNYYSPNASEASLMDHAAGGQLVTGSPTGNFTSYGVNGHIDFHDEDIQVVISREGKIRYRFGQLLVCHDCKALKVRGILVHDGSIRLPTFGDITMALLNSSSRVDVSKSIGGKYIINGKEMDKKSATEHLVCDYNLREKSAELMLKKADKTLKRETFIVKSAQIPLIQAPPAPAVDPAAQQSVPPMPGAPYEVIVREPIKNVAYTAGDNFDPNLYMRQPFAGVTETGMQAAMEQNAPQPDLSAMQTAIDAANRGQKELFDVSVIQQLLRSSNSEDLIDRYSADLLKGMDRIGRILFMLRWNREKFEDVYGREDVPNIEDSLVNTFESIGDLILALKESEIEDAQQLLNLGIEDTAPVV